MKPWERDWGSRGSKPWERDWGSNTPQFSEEALAQVKANNEAYARRQEENRPWLDKNPVGRLSVAAMQGMANAGLNPAGYIARGMGMDTTPFEPQNAAERIAELAGQYGYDAAPIGKALEGMAAVGVGGDKLVGKIIQEVGKGGASRALAETAGAATATGLANPENPYARFLTDLIGAGAVGSMLTRPTYSTVKGGLDQAVASNKATKTINSGIRAKEKVAEEVYNAVPRAKSELQDEMAKAIDKTVGRKLDRELAYENAKQSYDDFIVQNRNKQVLDLDNEGNIGYNGEKGVSYDGQIQENGSGGQVRLQQETSPNSYANPEDERVASLEELVKFGQDNAGTSRNGLFVPRNDGSGIFSINPEAETLFDKAGVSKINYRQLKNTPDEAGAFFDAITNAKKSLGDLGEQVYVYPKEEYAGMKLFLSEDGLSGVAVKPDGDIVSVFSNPDVKLKDVGSRAHAMVELAKQNGGTKLDAFDTFLPKLYSKHGFKEVGRDSWNEQYKPENWNKDFFKNWKNGEPDVVYMQLDKPQISGKIPPKRYNESGELMLGEYRQTPPSIDELMQGLSTTQQKILNSVLKRGAGWETTEKGSLKSVHTAQRELNKMITTAIKNFGKRSPEVEKMLEVKNRLNQALEFGGVKPLDARMSKAKTMSEFWDKGYNAKPSDYKYGKIDFKTKRDKQAYLQGVMQKMVDNVTADTNLAKNIKDNETIFRNLLTKKRYEDLMKTANQIDKKWKRIKSIEGTAERKLSLDDSERAQNAVSKLLNAVSRPLLTAFDTGLDFATLGNRSKKTLDYIKPEKVIKQNGGKGAASGRQSIIDLLEYFNNEGKYLKNQF